MPFSNSYNSLEYFLAFYLIYTLIHEGVKGSADKLHKSIPTLRMRLQQRPKTPQINEI